MPVKRQFFFFAAFVAIVVASYGVAVEQLTFNQRVAREHLPALKFYDKSGKKVTLDYFKGRIVLVDLWATWCTPCEAEMPLLDRVQKQFPSEKLKVVAISLDTTSAQAVAVFLKKKGIQNLPLYWDKDRQVPLKWKYAGIPTTFLLDRDGGIIQRFDGPYEWDKDKMLAHLQELVAK